MKFLALILLVVVAAILIEIEVSSSQQTPGLLPSFECTDQKCENHLKATVDKYVCSGELCNMIIYEHFNWCTNCVKSLLDQQTWLQLPSNITALTKANESENDDDNVEKPLISEDGNKTMLCSKVIDIYNILCHYACRFNYFKSGKCKSVPFQNSLINQPSSIDVCFCTKHMSTIVPNN